MEITDNFNMDVLRENIEDIINVQNSREQQLQFAIEQYGQDGNEMYKQIQFLN